MMLSLFKKSAIIDGRKVKFKKGATILEAAREAGIEIPTLCHVEGHPPTGVCRVCVVEVEGARTLVGSCHTPITNGMVVHTRSPKVLAARRTVIELMLAAHTGDCVNDPNADNCGLHNLASDVEAGAPRFKIARPRYFPVEENPYVRRDLSKCILCRKCVTTCRDIAGKGILSVGYRGFNSRIITGYDEVLVTDNCRDCGVCIEHCPTGALSPGPALKESKPKTTEKSNSSRKDGGHAGLLPSLKKELEDRGCLSREAMLEVAQKTDLVLSEVYGVSSFYSFLPRDAKAKYRIRICRCVPCEMKEAGTIVQALRDGLGIGPGEMTPDGKFAIEVVGCIGACDQAPAMMINDQLYGDLTPERVKSILKG